MFRADVEESNLISNHDNMLEIYACCNLQI